MVDPERGGDTDRMREPASAIDLFASETEPDVQLFREGHSREYLLSPDPPSKTGDRRRGSSRWLVAGALALAAALGFASGYTVATRQAAPGGLAAPPTTSAATLSDANGSSARAVPTSKGPTESGAHGASEVVTPSPDGARVAEAIDHSLRRPGEDGAHQFALTS
jgi:hypothetical protein